MTKMTDFDEIKKLDHWYNWVPLPFALVWELLPKPIALPVCVLGAPLLAVFGALLGLLLTTLASLKK